MAPRLPEPVKERVQERLRARDGYLREARSYIDTILAGDLSVDDDSESFKTITVAVAAAEQHHDYIRQLVPEIPKEVRS